MCQVRDAVRGQPGFNAMVCNLGVVGVLVEVTFDVIDDIYMTTIQKAVEVDTMLKDLAFNYNNEDFPFWRVDWVPRSKYGLLWAAREIPANPDKPDGDYPADNNTAILKFVAQFHPEPFLGDVLAAVYAVLEKIVRIQDPQVVEGPFRNMIPVDRWVMRNMSWVKSTQYITGPGMCPAFELPHVCTVLLVCNCVLLLSCLFFFSL